MTACTCCGTPTGRISSPPEWSCRDGLTHRITGRDKEAALKLEALRSRVVVANWLSLPAQIIQGLNEAIEWTRGENTNVRVTLVHIPEVDVRKVRTKMGLSQSEFATKFGLPPATRRRVCCLR